MQILIYAGAKNTQINMKKWNIKHQAMYKPPKNNEWNKKKE